VPTRARPGPTDGPPASPKALADAKGDATTASIETDVLVVGAGPGGSATAFHLASHGANVLLVDKATFPREKVCGDGLTPRGVRAIQKMGVDPGEPGFVRIDALRTYGTDGVIIDLRWPSLRDFPGIGLVRTRYDFDNLLLERAVKAGARILEGVEATRPVMDEGWVTGAILGQNGDSEQVKARFVVAADGASSRFAGQAGVRRDETRPLGIAARRYYRTPRPQEPVFESFLNLWDGQGLMPGYGWIFPLGDGLLNVGAGLLNTFRNFKDVSARKVFDVFVRQLPEEWGINEENAAGPLLSGPLPMGMNRRPISVPGMLLVGDAGGIVNPFNGEGIAYAIESGELAAELIVDALARNRPAVTNLYSMLLHERYGRYFHVGRTFVRLIGNPTVMRLSVKYGIPRKTLMRFALRFMANLTDGRDGAFEDKVMHGLLSMASER
jgi:geranylgeranyl reductase family protein